MGIEIRKSDILPKEMDLKMKNGEYLVSALRP